MGAAFLLLSLGAACGLSEGGTSDGGSSATDGGSWSDDGTWIDGSPSDGGSSGDASDDGSATDGGSYASPLPVNLATAGSFVILSKGGISTVPPSTITGSLGVSPAAATYITGFSLSADTSNVFSTSTQVSGNVYAADYAAPTPPTLTVAIGDMQFAFSDAAGRVPDALELNAGNLGGLTLTRGVYKWASGVTIPTNLTLTGSATDVWIFQIAQGLTLTGATKILLTGGALPKNVFWDVSGAVELGMGSHFEGVLLAHTAVTVKAGSQIRGRVLVQTVVDIASSVIGP